MFFLSVEALGEIRRAAACQSGSPESIGDGIRLRPRGIGNRPQPDYQPVGQTGDGQLRVADEALVDADLVPAVRGDDGDAAGTDFNLIDAAVLTLYGEGVRLGDIA